ncbi:hypothetical protein Trco_006141 [Trichoderma cornu-damae]|uniref:Uncharacterized protein n=1 Tax=Trichoderma cornu-damae TaxID=654480 RepID=A0A9P8QQN6_9HYPO|nr:hypothetical protein Trco_006141 [Trichoderma cornu-damae]
MVPAALTVARLDNGRSQDVLHLRRALLEGGQRALDHNLSRLERDLGGSSGGQLSQLSERLAQVLVDVSHIGLVGAVLLKDSNDQGVLRAHAAVGENDLHNLGHGFLVLVSKLQDDAILLGPALEQPLDLPVGLEKAVDDVELPNLLAISVTIKHLGKWRKSGSEQAGIALLDVVFEELAESLVEGLGREFAGATPGPLHNLAELAVQLMGHASVQGGELGIPFAVWQLRVAEHLDELLEGVGHDDRVVETVEDVGQHVVVDGETLGGLGADNNRVAVGGELANERLSLLDSARVVQGEYTEYVSGLQRGSGLLNELHNAVLLRDEGHVHLHDLDFGKGLAGIDVGAVLDGVLDELARAGGSELGGVVLLLKQAGLAVDREAGGADLFLPVDVVAVAVEEDEETTIAEGADADGALGAVDEEVVGVETSTGGGKLVPETFIDEVDGEDGLQDLLGRHLTLFQTSSVLGQQRLAGDVRLGDGTAHNRQHGVGALGSKTLGDELIQPASGDGVLLESLGLEQLDEIFDSGPEVTTNAQLLEGNDHVLSLEALAGVLGGDTAGSAVTLGLGSALRLGSALQLEIEVDLARGPGIHSVQKPDVADPVQGDAHGNLELGSRQVDTADHFGGRMLDLEPRVQLEEVELVIGVRIQVLDGAGRDVADKLAQPNGGLLHGLEGV